MALQTKTFKSNTTSNQFYLELTLKENSISQTNNTSNISYILKLYSGGWDFSLYKIGHSIKLAEKTVSSVERANANQYSLGTNSSITIASGTTTISHNSDGSKNMSIAFSIDMAKDSWTPGKMSVSGKSMTLTTIPRASTVSCSNDNIGSHATITINRASSRFTHTLSYTFGSLDGTIVTKTKETSYAWLIPNTFYAEIPDSKRGTGTITCDTYDGSTKIGTKTCTFTATVRESISKPTLSPTVVDNNSTTIALTGDNTKFIKYYSNAAVGTGAEARNSATLASQKITCGSKSISTISSGSFTGTINKVEGGSFTFSATDSRGYTASETVTKTLINYVKLTCSMNASAASTSGVAELKISGNYWNGNFGATHNTLTVQYRYKEQGGGYSDWTDSSASIDNSNHTYSATVTISGLNYLNAYTFQARAIDKLATVRSTEQTRKTVPVFDWGAEDFNFNVPVSFSAGVTNITQLGIADYIVEQRMFSVTENDYTCHKRYRVWNSGLIENWLMIEYNTAVPITTAWGSIFRSAEKGGFTWGKSFTNAEYLCITGGVNDVSSGNACWVAPYGAKSATKLPKYYICRSISSDSALPQVSWYACGT